MFLCVCVRSVSRTRGITLWSPSFSFCIVVVSFFFILNLLPFFSLARVNFFTKLRSIFEAQMTWNQKNIVFVVVVYFYWKLRKFEIEHFVYTTVKQWGNFFFSRNMEANMWENLDEMEYIMSYQEKIALTGADSGAAIACHGQCTFKVEPERWECTVRIAHTDRWRGKGRERESETWHTRSKSFLCFG